MKELCFDISTWQGGINYQAIKDRVNYCIIRAGFSTNTDNQFENHYKNLQGLNLGTYWYTYAKNEADARAEANKFLKVIEGKKFTLPLYLDIEDPSLSNLGKDTLNKIIYAFGEVITNAGYYFGVYTNLNWYNNKISGNEINKKYDWWIAAWGTNPPNPKYGINYGVWQFTASYNDFGVRLDADYVYKDYPTIIKEAHLNHLDDEPAPTPTPTPTPSGNERIKGIQTILNARYNTGLVVDGIYGPATKKAFIIGLQKELNKQYNAKLIVDGIFGPKTKKSCPNVRRYAEGNISWLIRAHLYTPFNYNIAITDRYDDECYKTVKKFQKEHGLVADGICGKNTFERMFK